MKNSENFGKQSRNLYGNLLLGMASYYSYYCHHCILLFAKQLLHEVPQKLSSCTFEFPTKVIKERP